MKYFSDLRNFIRDVYRAVLLIWNAGKGLSLLNMLLLAAQAVFPVLSLYIVKIIVDMIAHNLWHTTLPELVNAIVLFAVVQFLLAAAGQLAAYIYSVQQQRLTVYLAEQVLQKAISVDMAYYENPDYHDSLHMAQQRSEYQAPALLSNVNGIVLSGFSLLSLIALFLKVGWLYAVIFIGVSIPLACVKWYYGYRLFWIDKKYVPMEREANYYHQVLTGVSYAKEVRSFGFGDVFINRYRQIRSLIHREKDGVNRKFTLLSLAAQAVEVAVMFFIFRRLAISAWAGILTAGVFVIYLTGFQRLQTASKNFLQSLVQLFQQRLFLRDIFVFLDISPRRHKGTQPFPAVHEGLVAEQVSFTYPETGKEVLHSVGVKCRPGQVIAIVGKNGSGKSTLVKLIGGLYELQRGSIKIDSCDIAEVSDAAFRANSIFLFQDFEKYFLTVGENIALANELDVRRGDVAAAAAAAGADDFIALLADKYEAKLGRSFRRAEELSGGQWQKLALARIFYKQAKLVVLDEPTSHIDAIAEHEIFSHLREHAKDKMVILISHRVYNLKMADVIYVMDEGRIVQEGTYEELAGRDGIFRTMYERQKL